MRNYNPDQTDKAILNLLQKNARLTYKELAGHLNLSKSPIQDRVKRLERLGYISSVVVLIDPDKFETNLFSYFQVQLQTHSPESFQEFKLTMVKFEEILECYQTVGEFDFILKVVSLNIEAYNRFLTEKLLNVANIEKITSTLVLSQLKRNTAIPI